VLRRHQHEHEPALVRDESAILPTLNAQVALNPEFNIQLDHRISLESLSISLDALFELHAIKDLPVACRVSYSHSTHSISILPSTILTPNTKHTIIVNGYQCGYLNQFFSFLTKQIGPVRIIARQIGTSQTMLLTISRKLSLLAELVGSIAVRINSRFVLSCEAFEKA
jgi:hypothetical protein